VIQRRALVGIVFAASLSLLAACGFEAPAVEDHEHASVQATDFVVGQLRVEDTSIVAGQSRATASQFYLVATIVNNGASNDTLTAVTMSAPGPILTVATQTVPQPGAFVPLVFTFAVAGSSTTIQAPVVPQGETTGPTQPVPTATASVPGVVGDSASD
jgi:hypothetical protein